MTALRTILFIETGIVGGGSFESLYQMLRKLDRQKFDPLVCFLNKTRYMDLIPKLDIETRLLSDLVYSVKIPKFIRRRMEKRIDRVFLEQPDRAERVFGFCHGPLMRQLKRIIREKHVDLLYCNTQVNRDMFGCFAARDMGIPMISHLRSVDGKTFAGAKKDFANKYVSAYIANSSPVKDYWLERGISMEKTHLVFNAIDDARQFPVDVRKEFGLADDAQVITCTARLVPFKGHTFLLNAFAQLRKTNAKATLLLLGSGPEEQNLRQQAERLDITDSVHFAGFDTRGQAVMAGSDLAVLPSDFEPFGRVVIEAMLEETPVIGTAKGGILDIIRNEENGLLVEYGDTDGLATAMRRLLEDASLRDKCIEGGRKSVRTTFNLEARTKDIEAIMERVIHSYPT